MWVDADFNVLFMGQMVLNVVEGREIDEIMETNEWIRES
jgi:hypothetical protein